MGNKKLYSSQLLVIGFSILEIIATFLPAAKVYGQTFNLISPGGHMGSGVFFIVLSAIAILFTILKKKITVLGATLLGAALGVYQFYDFHSKLSQFTGPGLYLVLVASIGAFLCALFMLVQVKKNQ